MVSSSSLSATYSQNFSVTMIMATKDPVGIELAKTMNYLAWTGSSGYVTYNDFRYMYWANPDTGLSHWYIDSPNCSKVNPYYNSSHNTVTSMVTGQYYNWDFGYDNQVTYTKHWIAIDGYGSTYGYRFNAAHWGELYGLLSYDVYVNGVHVLIIPFFYTLYLSGGYWSTNIRIIYLTVSFIWPVLSIYAFTTSKSFIEGYVLSIAFYLIPLILFASASGIIPKTLISQLINIDLLVGFFVLYLLI